RAGRWRLTCVTPTEARVKGSKLQATAQHPQLSGASRIITGKTSVATHISPLESPMLQMRAFTHLVHLLTTWKKKKPIMDAMTPGEESEEEMRIDQLRFGINKMKNYYAQCRENRSITAEA
ncbi:hypothetical protein HAX54_032085, partial [Datura stramonium]|nr:hypothetical protein [Datura stramonium]